MTVRNAEFAMALLMAVFSGYLMWKSAELDIGWIEDEGPGGGAFPFWLAAVMLVSCIVLLIRWAQRKGPMARNEGPYFSEGGGILFLLGAGSLAAMLGLVHVIGVYGSVPLFMIFYMRFMGRHPWKTVLPIALATPVVTFLFFEIALTITLPKGYTEPLFYPLYDIFL